MIFPRKIFIEKDTKKFDITRFPDWRISDFYTDSFSERMPGRLKNDKIASFVAARVASFVAANANVVFFFQT